METLKELENAQRKLIRDIQNDITEIVNGEYSKMRIGYELGILSKRLDAIL